MNKISKVRIKCTTLPNKTEMSTSQLKANVDVKNFVW